MNARTFGSMAFHFHERPARRAAQPVRCSDARCNVEIDALTSRLCGDCASQAIPELLWGVEEETAVYIRFVANWHVIADQNDHGAFFFGGRYWQRLRGTFVAVRQEDGSWDVAQLDGDAADQDALDGLAADMRTSRQFHRSPMWQLKPSSVSEAFDKQLGKVAAVMGGSK